MRSFNASAVEELMAVVAQLRSPQGGCPWDREQTAESLMPYILEEAYETVDAIRRGQAEEMADELGDLLFQVILQAQLAQEQGLFDLNTIASKIRDKLIRRHPHVFGDEKVESTEEVRQNWERIKAAEKGVSSESLLLTKLQEYARVLPPLTAAQKISVKAAEVGFEFEDTQQVWNKLHEEIQELQEAVTGDDRAHQESELGDILFALVQIGRWYQLNPETALQGTNDRFIQRFALVEKFAGKPLDQLTLAELEQLWATAKQTLKQNQ
ncbi:MAG: nucleoside triphosphate pyrophosphohydrolase [Prochlorotrichaceae cyanobacterium]|jgi:XTP/dITP diphosphohydrolase